MTKKEIKIETVKANREEVISAIKEEIKGSDLSLKTAMEVFINARTKNPKDYQMVFVNGIQAVTALANKVGCKKAKQANQKYFMTEAQANQRPSSMR